jgi:Putative MetA-pathway of phenol degradation
MFAHRTFLIVLTLTALDGLAAAPLRAGWTDCGTLLQWGDAADPGAGPNLNEPLVTDRPDFTESPVTVGYGVAQLETGYTYTYDDEHGVRINNHSFPESLLRVGILADWFEVRIDWNYEIQRTETAAAAGTDSGADDLTVGGKIALTPQAGPLPEAGLILDMSVPSGAVPFSAGEVLPGINFCYEWDLTGRDTWRLGGSTALGGDVDEVTAHTCAQFSQSLSLEHAWTDRFHSYVEWYVLAPVSADTNHPQYYFDRGITVLLNDNLQWDFRAGLGLSRAADDFFAGTGLSVRYW